MIDPSHHHDHGNQATKKVVMSRKEHDHSFLPQDSTIQQIQFVSKLAGKQNVLWEFPHPIHRWAVESQPDQPIEHVAAESVLILSVPTTDLQDDVEMLQQVQRWVDASSQADPKSLMMTLQGTQIFWNHGRLAVLAAPDRLRTITTAMIEFAFYDAELREIERKLGDAWPDLEADMPLAFEFNDQSISRRKQLLQRFQQVLLMRGRLSRIAPHVHSPHVHPATLASQVAERMKERSRMIHRHEYLEEQIEVFERVYEMCGQRSSDFMLTRSGNTLEWIIIVLLGTQILLSGFEILTSLGQATSGP
jgi:hypothetical protein